MGYYVKKSYCYYSNANLNELMEELERGNTVRVYIDCIWATDNNIVQSMFRQELELYYGDNLLFTLEEQKNYYEYTYVLKEVPECR